MHGAHLIKTWSTTQSVIALSSGEAEYYGLVKGASQGLEMRAMLTELGVESKVVVQTDASAAKGIALRRGMGKLRHIEVNQLWVQDKVAKGEVNKQKDRDYREHSRSPHQVPQPARGTRALKPDRTMAIMWQTLPHTKCLP